eukprot:1136733-Pelagomonas_calceolata.AAC.4
MQAAPRACWWKAELCVWAHSGPLLLRSLGHEGAVQLPCPAPGCAFVRPPAAAAANTTAPVAAAAAAAADDDAQLCLPLVVVGLANPGLPSLRIPSPPLPQVWRPCPHAHGLLGQCMAA